MNNFVYICYCCDIGIGLKLSICTQSQMNTIVDDSKFSNVDDNNIDKVKNNEINMDDIDEGYKRIAQLIADEI